MKPPAVVFRRGFFIAGNMVTIMLQFWMKGYADAHSFWSHCRAVRPPVQRGGHPLVPANARLTNDTVGACGCTPECINDRSNRTLGTKTCDGS